MRLIDILFICCVCLFGCKNRQNEDLITTRWETEVLDESDTIDVDTILSSQDHIYAKSFWVYADSLLILLNKQAENVCFLEFYNLHTKNKIKELFRYGNGPFELLNADIDITGNILTVNDMVKKEVSFVYLDSVLLQKVYKPVIHKYYLDIRSIVFCPPNEVIMDNPNYFYDPNFNVSNGKFRLLHSSIDRLNQMHLRSGKYYTRNVSSGTIIPNYVSDRLLFLNSYLSEIEVYDANLNLLKRILGPKEQVANYTIIDNEVIFKKIIPFAYLGYCCDEESVYALYMGDFWTEYNRLEDNSCWILKLDWDGNLLKVYTLPKYIKNISLGGNGFLYATGLDAEENPVLLKLKL